MRAISDKVAIFICLSMCIFLLNRMTSRVNAQWDSCYYCELGFLKNH
ncbi:hypothetical protein AL464_25325 [Vibrio parahaemolyticus]|nr:hypothetical protein AL464_25325 [Vibrio parahaemolyticus]EGR0426153.1 hypothetical protein [Vibrio parahaemolyticus]